MSSKYESREDPGMVFLTVLYFNHNLTTLTYIPPPVAVLG